MNLSTKALIFAVAIQLALVELRTWLFWTTGYMTSDEFNYVVQAMQGTIYGTRYFFGGVLILLFKAFNVHDLLTFQVFMSPWLVFWAIAFVYAVYGILGLMEVSERTRAAILVAIAFFPAFSLHSAEFVSEQPGLTLGALGVYFWMRYARSRRAYSLNKSLVPAPLLVEPWSELFVSGLFFLAASYTRAEYGFFFIFGAAYWIYKVKLRAIPFILCGMALLIPTPSGTPSTSINAVNTGISIATTAPTTAVIPSLAHLPFPVEFLVLLAIGFFGGFGFFAFVSFRGLLRLEGWGERLLVLSSFIAFFVIAGFYTRDFSFYTHQGLGTMVRYANPMILGVIISSARLVDELPRRKTIAVVLIAVFIIATAAPFLEARAQANLGLPYDVLSPRIYGPLEARQQLLSFLDNQAGIRPMIAPYRVYMNNDWKAGLLMFRDIPGVLIFPDHTGVVQDARTVNAFTDRTLFPFLIAGTHPLSINCTQNAWNLDLPEPGPPALVILDGYCDLGGMTHRILLNSTTGSLIEVDAA